MVPAVKQLIHWTKDGVIAEDPDAQHVFLNNKEATRHVVLEKVAQRSPHHNDLRKSGVWFDQGWYLWMRSEIIPDAIVTQALRKTLTSAFLKTSNTYLIV